MNPTTARLGGIAAVLTLALSGCGLVDGSPEAGAPTTSAAVATPLETLIKAVPDETTPPYAFDIKGGSTPMSGSLDSSRKAVQLKIVESDDGITVTMALLMIEEKSWIKLAFKPKIPGMPKIPNKWLVVDPAKLKDRQSLPAGYDGESDPGEVLLLLRNAAGVITKGRGQYAGTTDLTASTRAEIVDKAVLTKLGEKAEAVPFEATVNDAGHLTSMLVKVPAAAGVKAATYRVTYSGFGTTEVPPVPVGDQQTKATKFVYEILNA
ncbi:hypothetical protein [Actinoplanes solisilvae]|uniref:hypothetical protein n=1 Tax=Actinoplanes solisilvae TaxID=2486853 RepID=UPI000FDC29A8|nr:hypothetical protein [Actinoplanes solisilvae]